MRQLKNFASVVSAFNSFLAVLSCPFICIYIEREVFFIVVSQVSSPLSVALIGQRSEPHLHNHWKNPFVFDLLQMNVGSL